MARAALRIATALVVLAAIFLVSADAISVTYTNDCPSNSHCVTCVQQMKSVCVNCEDNYTPNKNTGVCEYTPSTVPPTTATPLTSSDSAYGTCSAEHCITCDDANPYFCTRCDQGYVDALANGVCKPPCYISNCAECVLGEPSKCSVCATGFKFANRKQTACRASGDAASLNTRAAMLAACVAAVLAVLTLGL